MTETQNLDLPLLQASQAQKHVTVNEALVRLDGLAQITLQSRSISVPPTGFSDGDCYGLPSGCSGGWNGQDGRLAIASNGGWIFVTPLVGWSAWVVDEFARAVFLPGGWQSDVLSAGANGAVSRLVVHEADHEVLGGAAQNVGLEIPSDTVLFACSARIVEAITGTASSWTLDLDDGSVTFGTGMALGAGAYCTGLLGQPTTIYSSRQVRLTPVGGDFSGGRLRLAAHCYQIGLPV